MENGNLKYGQEKENGEEVSGGSCKLAVVRKPKARSNLCQEHLALGGNLAGPLDS